MLPEEFPRIPNSHTVTFGSRRFRGILTTKAAEILDQAAPPRVGTALARFASMRSTILMVLLFSSLLLSACGAGTYCQSGAKGTQCMPQDYARNPPGRGGPHTDGER